MAVVAPSPQPSDFRQQTLKPRDMNCHLVCSRATLLESRQLALRTHKPASQIACALPKGPANEGHLLVLDCHTSKADGFETHNTSRKFPSGICHVEVLVRNLATRKAFGAVLWKSAGGLRSTTGKVRCQI
jgi:hypothetical protein